MGHSHCKFESWTSFVSGTNTVFTRSLPEEEGRRRGPMQKWLCAVILAGTCAACGSNSQQPAAPATGEDAKTTAAAPTKPAEPVFKDITLPAGTTLRLELKSAVASDTS